MSFCESGDDDFSCTICLEVPEEPWQHGKCGMLLCKKCLDKLGRKPCPNCRMEKPQFFEDNRSEYPMPLSSYCTKPGV